MKKAGILLASVLMLWALILSATGVLAATDGYYQLSEVSQPAWDSTLTSRTKAPGADYDYTYGDEASVSYTLPWSFTFYGQPYTQITADTNGNIWLGTAGSTHSFDLAATGLGPVIAAWNNDLSSYFSGGVFIQHKTNPERVVIEWQTETYTDEGTGRPNSFAVVLFPNGTIRNDYGTFNPFAGKDFGSGISRGDGTASLSLTAAYGNAFSLAGRSFLFASGSRAYAGSLTENFGDVPAGTTSQPRTITLINGGTDNLLVSTATLTANSSGMFSLVAGGDGCSGATLAPSQSCTVQAVFSPSALGPQSAALSISSNDPTTPTLNVALTGTGLYPALTVTKGDTGAGTVTSSPAGISCGTACTGSFATGSIVTLTASPEAGSVFTGWAGACSGTGDCTVTMDTAKSVTASFTPTTPPTVTITSPTGIVAGKRPILQYGVSSGTAVVTVDGIVVSKVSGDALDTLAEGPHIIRIDVTNKAGYTAFAESTITVDTAAPTIVSVTPAADSQGVPINSAIIFAFSEELNSTLITKNNVALSSSFGQVPGTVSVSSDQKTVTFMPLVQLAYNRDYTVSFTGRLEDLAGNAVAVTNSSTFKTQTASPDLVGLWHMDGDWSDASGNGNHGTANGGATFSSDRISGTLSGSFDGIDDYVNIPNSASLNSVIGTWEFWVKIPSASTGNGYIILSKADSASSSNGISIYEYKGRIRFVAKSGGGSFVGSLDGGIIADNLYHHVAAVFSGGSSYTFYVDGISKGSGTMGTFTFSSQPLRFGKSVDTYWQPLKGLIDEVAIYKRALTQEEVKAKYDARPTINIASSGQIIKLKPGETGSATVTVIHPVGVINLTCAVSGAATSTFSATFDFPQTQVTRDFIFQISPNATAGATANIACTSVDAANNVGNAAINLTVADITVPMVLGSSIADNDTNVSATKSITVNLSKALAPASVNASSVTLTIDDGTNLKVDGVITLSTDQKSIAFTPTVALTGSMPYQFTVSTAVTDTSGNPLIQDFVVHFTTSPTVALNISGKGSSSAPYVVTGDRYSTITIDNSFVVLDGPVTVDDISLTNGSVLTHNGATTTATYRLEVTATTVNIDATSKIDVSGKGYLGGRRGGNNSDTGMTFGNTTTGGSTAYSGGSYGGPGGISSANGSVNAIYGSMQQPNELGSGGSANGSSNPGGNGGGLVKLMAGMLSLNGSIVADGAGTTGNGGGGGSGGGILLNIGTLSGTGTISAKGGTYTSSLSNPSFGSGGGGRIAIYYDTLNLPVANIVAWGGKSGTGSIAARNGGAGTIYLKDNAQAKGDVLIDNGGVATSNATAVPGGDYGLFDVKGKAVLSVTGNMTPGTDMVISGSQLTLNGGLTAPGNLTLDGSSVTVAGVVNVSGALELRNGSTLSHYGATTAATYKLEVMAASVSIDATSKIDVSGKGYPGGWHGGNASDTGMTLGSTTTGGSAAHSGGSYGGLGGKSSSGSVNSAYGSIQQPNELGSGGAANSSGYPGGSGGGLVKLVAGSLSVDGGIVANGGSEASGGSGGGILLNVGTLTGSGTISAHGGSYTPSTNYGSGGGGRIAIYYDTLNLPVANIVAWGGKSGDGSNSTRNGGAGTVYLKDNAQAKGDVVIDNGGIATSNATVVPGGDYGLLDVKGKAMLSVTGDIAPRNLTLDNSSVTAAGAVNVSGALELRNGSTLSHYGATTAVTYKLEVTAALVSIDATSKIDVSGKGYLGGRQGGNSSDTGMTLGNTTTGGSTYSRNGGSYGGLGGRSSTGSVNAVYGSLQQPNELGSGGSAYGGSNPGCNGGGLVKLVASYLIVDGSILANGVSSTLGGGGSGGGIHLNVGTLTGSGMIGARGGSYTFDTNYGSGGGGRIAIYYDTLSLPAANIVAWGGKSGDGSNSTRNGGAGTIYLKANAQAKGDVIIDNGGIATSNATAVPGGDYGLFDVKGGAVLSVTGNMTPGTDMVISGSQLTLNGGLTAPGNLTLDGSSVTVAGAVNVSGALELKNGSTLSHYGATTAATYRLEVTAATVSIDATSKIDVSGKGYLGGRQGGNSGDTGMTLGNTTTGGSTYYANGGSYGGLGGRTNSGGVNAAYGSIHQPNELGSGGSGYGSGSPGGNGGGLVKLTAEALGLDGSIMADGWSSTSGGSGGGILLNVGTLTGSGMIRARGGSYTSNTNYGSGGGGRIAIYYDMMTLPIANIVAWGGKSGTGSIATRNGGAGTIYLKANAQAKGDVIIDNGGIATSNATAVPGGDYGLFDVKGGAQITLIPVLSRIVNVSFVGTGTGIVTSVPTGIACNTDCSTNFHDGTQLSLTGTADQYSVFAGWPGSECGIQALCRFILGSDSSVTAQFDRNLSRHVETSGVSQPYNTTTIQDAYNASVSGDTIKLWGLSYLESVSFNRPVDISISGGYDSGYLTQIGETTLLGEIEITDGNVTIDGLTLQ